MTKWREETIGDARLICADCREVLPTLGKVDAVVTSPPYGDIRQYGGHGPVAGEDVITLLAKLIAEGGVIVWNVADQTVKGSETGESFRHALHAIACGMRLHDTMIYCKEGVTYPDANRYHPAFEYMFVFSNGAPKHFNGIRDWRNKWGGSAMHGTNRNHDGSTKPINGMGREVPTLGLRRNWWVIANPYIGETDGHPAPMPMSMASDHIATWTDAGETVLEPFMGSGTTGVACAKLGRRFVGIEIEPKYFDIAVKRITAAYAEPRLPGLDQPKPTQEAMAL